jgi:tetratricopeptide (TPR) repeat protein
MGILRKAEAKAGHNRIGMASALTASEEAQLAQTIEMFEVITQSQPNDYQSLEILKEAYAKLGRETDAVAASKRIAQAYVQMGQLSSAILEYETILQRCPEDPDVQAALRQIETKANNLPEQALASEMAAEPRPAPEARALGSRAGDRMLEVDDGRRAMRKIFVEGKLISGADFDSCWPTPDLSGPGAALTEPFVHVLEQRQIMPVEKSLRILSERSRTAFLPLGQYDLDVDLARSFPAGPCKRWCVLPFDRMSKSLLVATVNPFNQAAAKEIAEVMSLRLVWYLVHPAELMKLLRKLFR